MRKVIKCMWPLLCILSVAVGCTKEDNGTCITQNTTLLFRYVDETYGNDLFLQAIHSVDAYIFDEAKTLVDHRRFEQAELAAFPGWKLDLPPGNYYAVCWGNADNNSRLRELIPEVNSFDDGIIKIPDGADITSGSPIYYAPYELHANVNSIAAGPRLLDPTMKDYAFTVVEQRENVKEMNFVCAHRTINVYITGYADSTPAVVTGEHLCGEYDFYYQSCDDYRDFTQTAHAVTTPDGQQALVATFYVCYSVITGEMELVLKGGTGPGAPILETVNLREFLAANPSAMGSTIDILIRFYELGTIVTVPGWDDKPVHPE